MWCLTWLYVDMISGPSRENSEEKLILRKLAEVRDPTTESEGQQSEGKTSQDNIYKKSSEQ